MKTPKKQTESSPLNMVQISRVMTPYSTSRVFENIYYSHNDIFRAEQGNPLKLVQKCLERTGKGDWLGVFMWSRGGTGGKVLVNFLLAPQEAILGLYQFVRCGTEKQKGWVKLKKLSAAKNFKNGFWLFITLVY